MATKAIYSITSELNHPLLTENSPNTNAAMTLSGVLNMLGVLTAASFNPSIASSKIKNCQIKGILMVSETIINSKPCGMNLGSCINSKNVGVMI